MLGCATALARRSCVHSPRHAEGRAAHPSDRCANPRMLVLIMPATNYQPPGYQLVHSDDQLCRGSAFYTPGSNASNWINASKVALLS